MYEPSIRVPCFVHCPALIPEPQKNEKMVLNIDIGPTILDLAGAAIPASMHGQSFAPLLLPEDTEWRTDFLYEYFIDPKAVSTPTIFGLRNETYSYMTYEGVWDSYELYDLKTDPDQQNNLLGNITYGYDYGSFLQHVQRQDPALYPLVERLDKRLSELVEQTGGSRRAVWKH